MTRTLFVQDARVMLKWPGEMSGSIISGSVSVPLDDVCDLTNPLIGPLVYLMPSSGPLYSCGRPMLPVATWWLLARALIAAEAADVLYEAQGLLQRKIRAGEFQDQATRKWRLQFGELVQAVNPPFGEVID